MSGDRATAVQERRVALLDWDNSLHRGLTLRNWSHYLGERGLLPGAVVAAIEARYAAYDEGDFPYRRLATEAPELYARGLKGVRQVDLQTDARAYVERDVLEVFAFSRVLLDCLVDREIETLVVSGSPTETLAIHQERLPIRQFWGITTVVRDGRYTGELELNPAEQTAKDDVISTAVKEARVMLAVGDTEADIPMLDAAEARIVVDNDDLFSGDEATLHLAPDSTSDGGLAELRAFLGRVLDD